MTIEAMLHNGKELKCKVDLQTVSLTIHPLLQVEAFTSKDLSCPRCKKNAFILFKEQYRYICFCSETGCTLENKNASISVSRGEAPKESGLKESGAEKFKMGRAYKDAVLSKWIGSAEHHAKVGDWRTNQKVFMTILGAPGTGKTYLAAAMLNHLHEKGDEIAYVTHRKFIEEIHFAMQDGKTQHSVMPRYAEKKYLIIDDLGSATCTEWQQEMILELIDRRYIEKNKTIITSNFTKDELYKKLGARTASRLLDKNNEILEFWSTDRRTDPTFSEETWWQK